MTEKNIRERFIDAVSTISEMEVNVWESPYDVIDVDEPFRLIHYSPMVDRIHEIPTLIVYAYINQPYILDLSPEISVVRKYLQSGIDVYMIDWGYPAKADKYIGLSDYVDYVGKCVDIVKRRSGADKVNFHGYCLGGTLTAIYTALYQENVNSMVTHAAPIDFHTENIMTAWARSLDPDKIVDAMGNAPGEFLNFGFLSVDPIRLVVAKYQGLMNNLESSEFIESFLKMEKWIFDSPAIPGETFRQYIKHWYHNNELVNNKFELDGKRVDLRKIEIPILIVEARYDHIAPPESSEALLDVVSSKDTEVFNAKKGHVGVTMSGAMHKELWPKVCKWMKERSGEVKEQRSFADLIKISGLGDKSAQKLVRCGVATLEELADTNTSKIAGRTGISEKMLRKWADEADKMI